MSRHGVAREMSRLNRRLEALKEARDLAEDVLPEPRWTMWSGSCNARVPDGPCQASTRLWAYSVPPRNPWQPSGGGRHRAPVGLA